MLDISNLIGFEWDEHNRDKNWKKHVVSTSECEEIFFNLPLLLKTDMTHSQIKPRYFVLGQTAAGRRLFIAFTVREQRIRVISAREMSRKEREIYEQGNS